jgi:hypothetical protein
MRPFSDEDELTDDDRSISAMLSRDVSRIAA